MARESRRRQARREPRRAPREHEVVERLVGAEAAKALSLARAEGVVIREMEPGGPAARAGMQVFDVVVEIAGKPTRNVPQLLARIAELPPGSVAKVNVVRGGRDAQVDVTVGKRPPPERQ